MKTKAYPIVAILLGLVLANCSASAPENLGVRNGKLSDCPTSPNCVSSQCKSTDEEHYIEPYQYTGSKEEAFDALKKAISSLSRTEITEEKEDYLRVEFTSLIMRYVDDVEFYFPNDKKIIEIRSASRLGHSDFGVNRERMEKIRSMLSGKQ